MKSLDLDPPLAEASVKDFLVYLDRVMNSTTGAFSQDCVTVRVAHNHPNIELHLGRKHRDDDHRP